MLLASILVACSGPEATLPTSITGPTSSTTPTADTGAPESVCAPPAANSQCDNDASIVQGIARLPDDHVGVTTGELVVGMLHRRYGDPANGGHPHQVWKLGQVDLSEPVPFEVDMCSGNAIMWSEENCEYNLVVLLDLAGDNGALGGAFLTPAPDEPAALVTFDLSCHAEQALCLGEVELACNDGATCIADDVEHSCDCAEDACGSESSICSL